MRSVILRAGILSRHIERELRVLRHQHDIRARGVQRVGAETGAENNGYLRNRARKLGRESQQLACACEQLGALRQSAAYAVIKARYGRACLERKTIELSQLRRLRLAHRAAADVAVLCKGVNGHALNRAVTRDNLGKALA